MRSDLYAALPDGVYLLRLRPEQRIAYSQSVGYAKN